MSKIQQLSIFLENKPGQLTDVTQLLAKNELSIHSINLVDSKEFGILRVIVDNPQKAKEVLDEAGISLKIIEVFAVSIDDHVGSFNDVVTLLTQNNIDIQYTYILNNSKNGAFVFKVDPALLNKTIELLSKNGIEVLQKV